MRSLAEIQQIVDKLACQINPPASAMPTYGNFRDDGTPNIEVGDTLYYYRAFDRAAVTMNRQTDNLAKLLYWVFEDITATMATEQVQVHANPQVSWRKARFDYQLMLLEKLNPEWKKLREKEIEEILEHSPYKKTA